MTATTINSALLSDDGRRRCRRALEDAYPYLVRWAPADALDSIRSCGLVPRLVACDHSVDADVITAAFGGRVPPIICLSVPDNPVSGSRAGFAMQLAVRTEDLPSSVSLDWSYSGTWSLADIVAADGLNRNLEAVFLEVFRRRRSVVVCDPIAPRGLRVRLDSSSPRNPETWPSLLQLADSTRVFRK
jgi:hypothetical protein